MSDRDRVFVNMVGNGNKRHARNQGYGGIKKGG